jgi:threonine dehydrogenase-like Zn-dependent dehydrogenase
LARCLIIGCGCRGQALAAALRARGHAVRGTSRDSSRLAVIEAAGVEPHRGDPDRIATLAPAFDHVSVACILLGSAAGDPEAIAALHGPRLEMLLLRMLDTTIRGVAYEAAGTVDPRTLDAGVRIVRTACRRSLIPYAVLDADPAQHQVWLKCAQGAVDGLLSG